MKQLLIELDEETAHKLEQAAPGKARQRSEFVRNAIRRALWELEEKATADAYRKQPDSSDDTYVSADVWEPVKKRQRTGRRRS